MQHFPDGKYWWMVSNPRIWKLCDMGVGKEGPFFKYYDGKARKIASAFDQIRVGDWILGYVAGEKVVYSLLQCTKGLVGKNHSQHICFKKVRDLEHPIPWESFKNHRTLKNASMVRMGNQGSLFEIKDEENAALLKLLRGFRWKQLGPDASYGKAKLGGKQENQKATSKSALRAKSSLSPREQSARLKMISRTERLRETVQRNGQHELREYLLGKRGRCAVTGLRVQSMLVASHIKDWKMCKRCEKLDEENVLLLARNYDAAFDRKLISFNASGKIVKSGTVSWKELASLGIRKSAKISRPRGRRAEFLAWHRAHLAKSTD